MTEEYPIISASGTSAWITVLAFAVYVKEENHVYVSVSDLLDLSSTFYFADTPFPYLPSSR